jgi:N-acetyl-gamma-glutamyl-phosphate reductase
VVIDSKTGSSGSGKEPGEGTHHPTRAHDFRAYGLFKHRHRPEIAQELARAVPSSEFRVPSSPSDPNYSTPSPQSSTPLEPQVVFTPHSAPMVRGIFTTAYAFLKERISQLALTSIFEEAYSAEHFVRLTENPRVAVVTHSNFCDLNAATDGDGTVIVTSAIDNLVKGGAGQGVQNLNVAFGWPEHLGLSFPGTMP